MRLIRLQKNLIFILLAICLVQVILMLGSAYLGWYACKTIPVNLDIVIFPDTTSGILH